MAAESDTYYYYGTLVAWIFVIQAVGATTGYFTRGSIRKWYKSIKRSPLTPPNYVFPVVWTTLYIMIAIAGWKLTTHGLAVDPPQHHQNPLRSADAFELELVAPFLHQTSHWPFFRNHFSDGGHSGKHCLPRLGGPQQCFPSFASLSDLDQFCKLPELLHLGQQQRRKPQRLMIVCLFNSIHSYWYYQLFVNLFFVLFVEIFDMMNKNFPPYSSTINC